MGVPLVLTIAVPVYNMERWLMKNLATYMDASLVGRVEVLCLNNASEDRSKEIIESYVEQCPAIFVLLNRKSRGYGGSINEALKRARGKYFRIVDADDWVDTAELVKLADKLETCGADVVYTDYRRVDMTTGEECPVRAGDMGAEYGREYREFNLPARTLPSIHGTTYRTALLQESGFYMQDGIFFADEEYVILPYMLVRCVVYYPFDVYRYQVANPAQSTSPQNRGKYQEHRERILKRLIGEFLKANKKDPHNPALPYCFERIRRGVGDHFTTLYMYVEPRKKGGELAKEWRRYVQSVAPVFWQGTRSKAHCLAILHKLHVSRTQYEWLKKKFLPERLGNSCRKSMFLFKIRA